MTSLPRILEAAISGGFILAGLAHLPDITYSGTGLEWEEAMLAAPAFGGQECDDKHQRMMPGFRVRGRP